MNTLSKLASAASALVILALAPIGVTWAQVKVVAADPAATTQGTESLDVTITGSGFDSTANATFFVSGTGETGGITVQKTVFKGSKQLIATIAVSEGAVVNKFDIEVTLSNGRKGKGTTLFSVTAKVADPCIGATASFMLSKPTSGSSVKTLYLSDESGTCLRTIQAVSAGNYNRYLSFRVVANDGGTEGRVVTTDGLETLLLLRFPIGPDMQVDPGAIQVAPIFDPTQVGFIDVTNFELGSDGRHLVYVTSDEPGGGTADTRVYRLRFIEDVSACVPPANVSGCQYGVGTLLEERVGNAYWVSSPRWSADGSQIYLEDRRNDFWRPYISRVSVTNPRLGPGEDPEIVMIGNSLSLFEVRTRGFDETLVFADSSGTGCRDVRVVLTASCSQGNCATRVNSTSPRALVSGWATLQSIGLDSLTILADEAKEGRKGSCISTGNVARVVDSLSNGVQSTTLVGGANGPAAK
jgi:hypothetical protein